MIVSREDQAPSVNDTGALWVSDLWEKIVAGRVGHTGDTTLAAKKADRFGFPPSRLRSRKMPSNRGKPRLPCQEFWSINVISAVTASGAFWAATYTGKLNAESFVVFLKNFMKGRRHKVLLVVDGHPAHKANLVKEYIAELAGRLELHFLPPYAPDLNPDEFVWNHMKNNGVSKKPLKKNESLRERAEQDLAAIYNNKVLVASFFSAKSVAYVND